MAEWRNALKVRSPLTSSTRAPYVVSVAVHAVILGALVWMTARGTSKAAQDPGIYGTTPPDSVGGVGGLGTRRSAPPLGPSVRPSRVEQYLGRYVIASADRPDVELLVTLVNDGADHWSLVAQEREFPMYKLVPVAPDSFVQQFDRERRVVFVRHDSTVIAIELSGRGKMRRGVKVLTPKRD